MTHKENITTILECYFAGFKKEIVDSACNRILMQEQELIRDRIRREIDKQDKWLMQAGYTLFNVEMAHDAIKSVLDELEV